MVHQSRHLVLELKHCYCNSIQQNKALMVQLIQCLHSNILQCMGSNLPLLADLCCWTKFQWDTELEWVCPVRSNDPLDTVHPLFHLVELLWKNLICTNSQHHMHLKLNMDVISV